MNGESRRCAICGKQVRRDGHHLTGRGQGGLPLDDDLIADLCHDDHELVHDDLRRLHIDTPLQSSNVLERIERRLQRVGVFLGRVGEATGITWSLLLAVACVRWASELRAAVVALDRWNGDWRGVV
jgi:hypothetical protein